MLFLMDDEKYFWRQNFKDPGKRFPKSTAPSGRRQELADDLHEEPDRISAIAENFTKARSQTL